MSGTWASLNRQMPSLLGQSPCPRPAGGGAALGLVSGFWPLDLGLPVGAVGTENQSPRAAVGVWWAEGSLLG